MTTTHDIDNDCEIEAGALSLQMRKLTAEDKADMVELMELILEHRDGNEEEFNAAASAFHEILFEQTPCKLVKFPLSSSPDSLKRWKDYVSAKIKAARDVHGFTQNQLAIRANLPQSHISRLESGKHSPSHLTLEKIAKAMGMQVSDFDPSAPE